VVLAAGAGLTWLAAEGHLTEEKLQEVRAVFTTDPAPETEIETPPGPAETGIATEEVMQRRVLRAFDLESREREVALQSRMVVAERDRVLADRLAFEQQKAAFRRELKQLQADRVNEAAEQARGVLEALSPADAVANLMGLDLDRNLLLLRDLPAKTIGKILKEMGQGDDVQRKRGLEIFDALSRGNPELKRLETAQAELNSP
jgi:hypothetical protein